MVNKVKIGNKVVGDDEPVFIVAEIGLNHCGDLKIALESVKVAAESGADAVKFQIFKADELYSKKDKYYKLFKALELPREAWEKIANFAEKQNILFAASVFDEESVDLLSELDAPFFKIASGDITHIPLIKYIARKNKPVILSTGMSTIGEIEEALNAIYSEGNRDVILLHCVSRYPANYSELNLRAINTLKNTFKVPVGFSDHTIGILASLAAVALGANVIEKHFTINKNLPGPDHKLSLEPHEFKELVKGIRNIEEMLGDGVKRKTKSELHMEKVARRSIVARIDIPKGTVISKDMLKISRPGIGIAPKFLNMIIGRVARKDIRKDEVIRWEFI